MRTYCIWMSHVIYEWVMSRMNESWTLDGITSLEEESNESYKTSMSHVTYMNESCHRHGWVMDTWWDCLSRGDIYRVMSHINESCHIYGWGMDTWWQSLSEDACKEESRCVAVCCSVLQCVAVCCSVLQCFAVCASLEDACKEESSSMPHMNESCRIYEWFMDTWWQHLSRGCT